MKMCKEIAYGSESKLRVKSIPELEKKLKEQQQLEASVPDKKED